MHMSYQVVIRSHDGPTNYVFRYVYTRCLVFICLHTMFGIHHMFTHHVRYSPMLTHHVWYSPYVYTPCLVFTICLHTVFGIHHMCTHRVRYSPYVNTPCLVFPCVFTPCLVFPCVYTPSLVFPFTHRVWFLLHTIIHMFPHEIGDACMRVFMCVNPLWETTRKTPPKLS